MTEQREPVDEPVTAPGQDGESRWAPVERDPATVPQGDEPTAPAGQAEDASSPPADGTGVPEAEVAAEPVAAPDSAVSKPAAEAIAEPVPATVPETAAAAEPEPVAAPEPEPEPEPVNVPVPEPEPVSPEPAPEPVIVPELQPEPVAMPEPEPAAPQPEPEDPAPTAETVALPRAAATVAATQPIFRDSPTAEDTVAEPLSEEAQKLAAERAARKEAREAALAATAPVALVAPEPVVIQQRTNDKFPGSLGLFLLRLVVAAIFTVRGLHMVTNLVEVQEQFAQTIIPYPQVMAIVTAVSHLLIALAMVLGLLTRVAGLGVALIAGGALVFVLWGPWNVFLTPVPGQTGAFLGEFELLLAAVGLLFLLIGGGGWSLDRSFRSARAKDKAERQMAA